MAQRSSVFISSQGLIPLLYNIASPPCWRPTWRMGFWSFRFLILKQRAIRAQISVDLPRNSSLLSCLSLQLGSNNFYGIHNICWCSRGAIKTAILFLVMAFSSPIFRWSILFAVNNGRQSGHGINWLANQWPTSATTPGLRTKDLRICRSTFHTAGLAMYLRRRKAFPKGWQSGRQHFAKRLQAIIKKAL